MLRGYYISTEQVDKHLKATLRQRKYYGELLDEICQSLWRSQLNNHTLAFLHIYRFLEHISFAFPLLYASRTTDFSGAYSSLKEFFSGGDRGELGFFKKFTEASMDPALLAQSSQITFHSIETHYRSAIYSAIRRQIPNDQVVSESRDNEITIKNDAIIGLCITLRNRFFHYTATNTDNISIKEVGDADALFHCVNRIIFNWLAVIYFETLKHRVQNII